MPRWLVRLIHLCRRWYGSLWEHLTRSTPCGPWGRRGLPEHQPRCHMPPKPKWVKDEVIRLKALMPEAGCRTIAHHFNRRWAARRQMTVSRRTPAGKSSTESSMPGGS